MKDFVLIIPYYNNYSGLLVSLYSVQYDPGLYEVLIVDDGSKQPLSEDELQQRFTHISLSILRNETNQGIVYSLNKALNALEGRNDIRYIARLDCGDECHPERFYRQIGYLNQHPEVALIGSKVLFREKGSERSYVYGRAFSHHEIRREMHYRCSFIHPSVIFSYSLLSSIGHYPEDYPHCEDYAFFFRITRYYQTAILDEVLVTCEAHKRSISARNRTRQLLGRIRVIHHYGFHLLNKLSGIIYTLFLLAVPQKTIQQIKYSRR